MTPEDHLVALAQANADGPVDLMRLCLFDWAVCAWAGRDEPVAQILAMQGSVEGDASVVGGGYSSAPEAALINGTAGHALDYDDTHFDHIGHTSAVIMPAMLAVAEDQMLGIEDLLEAALIGSEAAVRTGLWLGRGHYQIGFHQTATAGAFGAAVGVCRLLGLDAAATRHAVGLCATAASGLKGQFGTMGKPLNAGLAARVGAESGLWAGMGMTSDAAGLQQFGTVHHGAADDTAWQQGERWRIGRISHKFHACCHGLHAMLEALKPYQGAAQQVQISTHPRWLSVCNIPAPRTGLEIKFSYAMTAAMALRGISTAATGAFSDAAAHDPDLIALRDRVSVEGDPDLTEMQARVRLTDSDGQQITLFGDLAAPLTHEIRETRLIDKARAVVGKERADQLWRAVQDDTLEPLTALLRG